MNEIPMIPESANITGVVLCGGRGQRMGGQDKGLLSYRGQTLVAHALDALSGVAESRFINANRNADIYGQLGVPVIADVTENHAGPLAGLLAALRQARTPFVLTLACDMPHFDRECLARLCAAWEPGTSEICTVYDGVRLHPVVALVDRNLADSLAYYLSTGQRKVETWFRAQRLTLADFSDKPDVLVNLNTPEDWSHSCVDSIPCSTALRAVTQTQSSSLSSGS